MKFVVSFFLALLIGSPCYGDNCNLEGFNLFKQGSDLEKVDPAKSLEYYDKAIAADSHCMLAFYGKEWLLRSLTRYDEALATIDDILQVAPLESQAFLERARIYRKQGKNDLVKKYLEEGVLVIQKKADIHKLDCVDLFNKPLMLSELGREKEADRAVEELDNLTENPTAWNGPNDCVPKEVADRARSILNLRKAKAALRGDR